MSRLILAICPSNQDGNPVVGNGSEMEHIRRLAFAVYTEAARQLSIIPMVFEAQPESADDPRGSLAGLRSQQYRARDWIAGIREDGDFTVSLNLHSDSGLYRHCGYYYDRRTPVSPWLGRALAEAVKGYFGWKVLSADYSGYVFAEELRPVACPVLLEMGSHQMLEDVESVREHSREIARDLVSTLVDFFGLESDPPLNLADLRVFAEWGLARCANGEDPRIREDFVTHLQALGADPSDLSRWGWPA